MALSDEHLIRHILEIHSRYMVAGDGNGGGHAGISLGIYCGILGETPHRVLEAMKDLKWDNLDEKCTFLAEAAYKFGPPKKQLRKNLHVFKVYT